MKIKINKGVYVCGPDINLNDYRVVYSVDDVLAKALIASGRAVEVVESKTLEVVEDTHISSAQEIPQDPTGTVEEVQPVVAPRKKFNPRDHK
jgi:hypothetical protein